MPMPDIWRVLRRNGPRAIRVMLLTVAVALCLGDAVQAAPPNPPAMFTRSTPLPAKTFGKAAGDVNGDGYADIIATSSDGIVLLLGSPSGVAPTPAWTYGGPPDASSHFAGDFAAAGDINGDGYDDVIIGDVGEDNSGINEPRQTYGRAFVFLGSATGFANTPDWIGHESPSDYGSVVNSAGDLNADGYGDIVVATTGDTREYETPRLDGNCARSGAVYVYFGGPEGLSDTPGWNDVGAPGACFGFEATGVGDVNGDGYDDLLIGATWDGWSIDGSSAGTGRALVYYGSEAGLGIGPDWSRDHPGAPLAAIFGLRAAGGGDVNADGFDDVLIGGALASEINGSRARSNNFLFLGGPTGLSMAPDWQMGVFTTSDFIVPDYIAFAGDVDGDGYGDVLARPPASPYPYPKVALFHGNASGLHEVWGWSVTTGTRYHEQYFAPAGDVDGDGYDDIVVQVSQMAGSTLTVYYGGPNPAPSAQAQSVTTPRGVTLGVALAGADLYDDPLSFGIDTPPANGRLDGLDALSGQVEYIPNHDFVGTDSFAFSVTDPYGNTDTATVDVSVTQGAPVFVEPTPDGPLSVEVGEELAFVAAADDPEGDRVTYSVSPRPDGARIDVLSGEFSWRPDAGQLGDWSLELWADDGHAVTTRLLEIRVVPRDTGDAGHTPDAGSTPDAGADAAPDAGVDADAPGADAALVDGDEAGSGEGCGCTSSGSPRPDAAVLLVLLAWVASRVRRVESSG